MDQESNAAIIELIKELQKQITYLERKIDTLVAQSAHRPSGPKNFAPRQHGSGGFAHQRREEGGRYYEKKKPFRPGDREREAKKFREEKFRGHNPKKFRNDR